MQVHVHRLGTKTEILTPAFYRHGYYQTTIYGDFVRLTRRGVILENHRGFIAVGAPQKVRRWAWRHRSHELAMDVLLSNDQTTAIFIRGHRMSKMNIGRKFRELATVIGDSWKDVEDVDAEVRRLRGDDDAIEE